MGGRVVVRSGEDRFEIQRAFGPERVRVRDLSAGTELFEGDGNPAARNQEATHYREIITDLLGLPDLEGYRRTLFIGQGELPSTSLSEHLLRVAAGGHQLVDTARRSLAGAHRELTRRPLHPGGSAAVNPRELEKVEDEIRNVEERLESARSAAERRAPLVLDRDRIAARLADMDERVELLEQAVSALARTDATELSSQHRHRQVQRLRAAVEALDRAARDLETAREAREETEANGRYPGDFAERMARAETRWRDLAELAGPPALPLAGLGAVALLAGVSLLLLELPLWAAIAGISAAVAWVAWGAVWLWVRRRRSAARDDLARIVDGVPSAETLGPESTEAAMAGFRSQQSADARVARARDGLANAIREARAALRSAATEEEPEAGSGESQQAVGRLRERLEGAAEALRERLARDRLELDRIGDVSLALPDGVAPTDESVSAALRASRAERSKIVEEYQDVTQELLERGTPGESVDALETRLRALRSRRADLERRARVLEAATALVVDAYDTFRDRDQDRLVEQVSAHAARLAGGIGGIETEDGLEGVRVRIGDRLVPMTTPPLSFGEYHALLLAVRLGAADFLAGIGIVPPLVVDEPFAHLDDGRAAAVWRQLVEITAGRQVLITTQETNLLDRLGVEPDLTLG